MKKYNLFKVIAITVFVAWVLTLIIPGSQADYSGNISTTGVAGVGIFGLLSNLNISISYFNGIALLLIAVACLYAVLEKVSAYERFVGKVAKLFENKKGLLVSITIVTFGILSMFINEFLSLLVFVPFVYRVMEKLEIDKKVMLSSTLVAALIGSMCSIYNTTLFGTFSLSLNTLLLVKVIVFLISIATLIVLIAPKKVQKVVKKSKKTKEEKVQTENKKIVKEKANTVNKTVYMVLTLLLGGIGINKFYAKEYKKGILRLLFCWTFVPLILSIVEFITLLTEKADKDGKISVTSERRENTSFAALLIIFVLFVIGSAIPWESLINKLTVFTDFNTKLGEFKIAGYSVFKNIVGAPVATDPIYGTTTGVIAAFGSWAINDLAFLLFVLVVIIAIANKMSTNDFISTITSAIKKILPVALTAMLISIVLVMMVTTGVNVTIANFILKLTKGFNIATTALTTMIGSVLTADFYYFLSTTGSLFPMIISNKDYYGAIAFALQALYNFMMIIAPTSVGLVIGLYYLNIPYNKWIKHIWKLLLVLFIVIIITTTVIYVLV